MIRGSPSFGAVLVLAHRGGFLYNVKGPVLLRDLHIINSISFIDALKAMLQRFSSLCEFIIVYIIPVVNKNCTDLQKF